MSGVDLAEASGATQLAPGDPHGIRQGAAALRNFGVELSTAADIVAAARATEWTGAAARVFQAAQAEQPGRLRAAGDAFAHAAAALFCYADVLEDAQADAARALALWADGQHATATWRAQQAQAEARGLRVGAPSGWDMSARWSQDPGLDDRRRASRLLDAARDSLATEAEAAAKKLREAAEQAPTKPGWLSRAWHDTTHAAGDVWHGVEHAGVDLWHGIDDVGHFIADHPEITKALEDAGQTIAGLAAVAVGDAAIGAGIVVSATGAGAIVGVPLAVEGAALAGLGAYTATHGADHLSKDINQIRAEANTKTDGSGEVVPAGRAGADAADQDVSREAETVVHASNGGLGRLESVDANDPAANALAERIGGIPSVRFANGPDNEFDAVSDQYVAQAKPANFTLNRAFRNQAKTTFEVAVESERTPYFQFDGPPGPGVIESLRRYAARYNVEPVIDLTPLEGS